MPDYVRGIDVERRPWQRRMEVFSPKLGRRVTHFSRTAYEAWLLLESDPTIKTFCERRYVQKFGRQKMKVNIRTIFLQSRVVQLAKDVGR